MLNGSKFGARIGAVILSVMGLFAFALPARAINNFETASIIYGYRSCSWQDNGDGTSMLRLLIDYKKGVGSSTGGFQNRGILIYTYDKNGNMNSSSDSARSVWLNGNVHTSVWKGRGYVMYIGSPSRWGFPDAFTADVAVLIDNNRIADWPAISVRAGNYTFTDDVGEESGAAYFSRYGGSNSSCKVIDPVVPPPPTIGIDVMAPDWNLGELPRGEGEKVLSSSSDQLCFNYIGAGASGKQFIINAGSANGVVNNRYRLKNLKGATQFVPYSLTLDRGTSNVSLPNTSNKSLPLNSSGRTCFVPTFRTTVGPTVDEGDYSDVLTFTVVTKP
ncbi:hypothetical protein [Burkholderia stagnalis]